MNRPIVLGARLLFGAMFLFAAATMLHAQATGGAAPAPPPPARGLVLVELFTSEGCPHCPEADSLLERLYSEQPVPGVEIVPIEEHVDYWDRPEWVDHFSSPRYTQRQKIYADAMDLDSVYTPQMVADGLVEFVGNNEGRALATISALGHATVASLRFSPAAARPAGSPGAQVQLEGQGISLQGPASVFLVLTEDKLVSRVGGGKNSGETWKHSSIARWFYRVAKLRADEKNFSAGLNLAQPDPDWRAENLRLIAFVQEDESQRVLAIGVAPWSVALGAAQTTPAASRRVPAAPAATSKPSGPVGP